MKAPQLTEKEIQILKSMKLYWDEKDTSEQPHHVFIDELRNVQNVISPRRILQVISQFLDSQK